MAQKLEYTIGIKADASQFKAQLNELLVQLNKLGEQTSLTPTLQKSSSAAKELAYYMQKATNPDTGKLNLTTFNQELKKSGKTIQQYAISLNNLGNDGRQAFMQVAKAIMSAEQPLKRSNELMDKLWITMKNTMRWQVTTNALNAFTGSLQTAYGYSQDLNKSLNDIRIVSEKSAENMKQFAVQANRAAKELSTTTTKYTDASLIYFQQGLDEQQVKERTDITIKMANVTGDAVETVSDQMTAVWNNFFENGGQSLEHYADAMTALGAATASSTDEIAGGLEKFSSIADMIGLSFDYAASALATITATTRQSEEVVGTALKTILARIQGLNLGETLDDGTTLNKYSRALEAVGISIKDQNGELKEMDTILDEMGEKWTTLNKDQQVALAQTVAGVRQYNQLVSLMDNWAYFQENLATAQNSDGELSRQAEVYAESWEAARNQVRAAAEDIYSSLIDEDFYIAFDKKFLAPMLTTIAGLADGMGGLSGILSVTAILMNKAYGPKIANAMRDMAANINLMSSSDEKLNQALQESTLRAVKENIIFGASDETAAREKQILEIQKDYLNLQQQVNKATKGWTDYQKQGFDYLLREKKTLQENLTLYNQIAQETQSQIEQLEYSYSEKLIDLTEKQRTSFLQSANNYDFSNIIGTDLAVFQSQNQALFADLSEEMAPQTAYSALRDSLKDNIAAEIRWKAINEQVKLSQGQVTDETKKLAVALGILDQATADSYQSQDEWNNFAREAKLNAEGLLVEVRKLESALIALSGGEKKSRTEVEQLSQALRENYVATLRFEQGVANTNETEQNRALGITLSIKELKALKQALDEGVISQETYNRLIATQRNSDFTNDLIKAGSAIAGFQMWTSGLEGLHNTLERMNEDGLTLSTLNSGLMSLVMMGSALKMSGLGSLLAPVGKYFKEAAAGAEIFGIKTAAAGQAITRAVPWLMAIGIAVTALIEIFDLITVSQEEAQEKIEKSISAYEEEKSKLEELNSTLEETEKRIKELESQSTLTIVEQEELEKLKKSNKLLKEQSKLQKEKTKQQAIDTANDIKENYAQAYNINNTFAYRTSRAGLSLESGTIADAEEYLQSLIDAGASTKRITELQEKIEEQRQNLSKLYSDSLDSLLTDYQVLYESVEKGYLTAEEANLPEFTAAIQRARFGYSGESEAVYNQEYLAPIASEYLNDATRYIKDPTQGLSKKLKEELLNSAITEEEFKQYLINQMDKAQSVLTGLESGVDLNSLDIDTISLIAEFNIDKYASDPEALTALEAIVNGETKKIKIVETVELEDGAESIDAKQEIFKTAFDTLNEQRYLNESDVRELLKEDPTFATYLKQTGEGKWGITQSAVDQYNLNNDYLNNITQDIADRYIAATQGESREAIRTAYVDMFNEITEECVGTSEGIAPFITGLSTELANYVSGARESGATLIKSLTAQYEAAIDNFTEKAVKSNGELTETAGKALSVYSSLITTVLGNQMKLFQSGQISMKEMHATIVNAQKAAKKIKETELDRQERHLLSQDGAKYLNEDKTEIKEDVSDSQKAAGEVVLGQLEKIREQRAELEKQDPFDLDNFTEFTEVLDKYSGYLSTIKDEYGQIDTTINIGVNSDNWKNFTAELSASMNELSAQQQQIILDRINELTNGSYTTIAAVQEKLVTDQKLTSAASQAMMEEQNKAVDEAVDDVADLFDDIAETVDSFNFTIKIKTEHTGGATLQEAIASGDNSLLPEYTITGASEGAASSISTATAKLRNTNYSGLSTIWGRSGVNQYINSDNGLATEWPTTDKNSGSKSSTLDKKDKKEVERYLRLNRLIEQQNDLLKENETLTDRAVGLDKLRGFDKQLEVLEQQQEYYKQKQKEAEGYLNIDRSDLLKELGKRGFAAEFGENNELLSYEDILNRALEPLTKIEETWNRLAENQTLVTSEQKEALQAQYDAALNNYEAVEKTINQYLETLDVIREIKENLAEAARNAADIRLEKITTKADTITRAKEGRDSLRETYKELWESYGDALTKDENGRTHIQNIMGLDKQMMEDNLAMLPYYRERLTQLEAMYHSDDENIDKDAVLDEIYDVQEAYLQAATDLNDYVQELEERFPEALEAAKDRYSEFTDALEHNSTVVDLIKQLYELQGVSYKTTTGFNALYQAADTKYQAQLAKADLQKQWYDSIAAQLADAETALAGVAESDIGYDILKAQRDTLLEEYYEAEEAYLTSAQETLQSAREIFSLELERAMYEFESILTNGLGLSDLQTQYDHYIEENARYFDQVNEAYEIASWYNKLQADIDDTANAAHVAQLKTLQEEIDMRAENNTLNQYDLDILEAKYNLLQAQMALEDARNAKNNLQLVRDSQGNWNYQYTADQDNIADAESKVLDAQNDWYNIAKEQTEDITQQIITNWQEAMDAVQEIYNDDTIALEDKEAKANEILRYYAEKSVDLEREKWQAINDMTEAGEIAVENYDTTYSDSLANMTTENKDFEEHLREYLGNCKENFQAFQDKVGEVTETTGTDMDTLQTNIGKVADKTDDLREASEDLVPVLSKLLDQVKALVEQFSNLNKVQGGITTSINGGGSATELGNEAARQATYYDASVDYNALLQWGRATGLIKGGSDEEWALLTQRQNKITDLDLNETVLSSSALDQYEKSGEPSAMAKATYSKATAEALIKKLLKQAGFDTGGYTGVFDDARLAFLHQKELVLNATDTENMLAAVQLVREIGSGTLRSIEKALDSSVLTTMATLNSFFGNYRTETPQTQLEQSIHIDKVEFPNATDRNEIEEAFRSLTNDAAQWARLRQ